MTRYTSIQISLFYSLCNGHAWSFSTTKQFCFIWFFEFSTAPDDKFKNKARTHGQTLVKSTVLYCSNKINKTRTPSNPTAQRQQLHPLSIHSWFFGLALDPLPTTSYSPPPLPQSLDLHHLIIRHSNTSQPSMHSSERPLFPCQSYQQPPNIGPTCIDTKQPLSLVLPTVQRLRHYGDYTSLHSTLPKHSQTTFETPFNNTNNNNNNQSTHL